MIGLLLGKRLMGERRNEKKKMKMKKKKGE